MKKLMSILLAVAVVATMAFSMVASAAETVDLTNTGKTNAKVYANDEAKSTVTVADDGTITVDVKSDWDASKNVAYGVAVESWLEDYDLTATPNIHLEMNATAPFRITLLDKTNGGNATWITFGSEFYNVMIPTGGEALTAAPQDGFFPAGSYDVYLPMQGFYDYKTETEGVAGYDPTAADLIAFYFEMEKVGTMTINTFELTADDGTAEGGNEGGAGNEGGNTTSPTTADNTQAVTFAVVAMAAAGVVTLSVVAKKAKSR